MSKPIKEVAAGTRSGKLVVLREYREIDSKGRPELWLEVKCDCGNTKSVRKGNFNAGKVTTCGCVPPGKPFPKKHGLGGTPVYNSWHKMMSRCYNVDDPEFKNYGARGIMVCERWHDVANFAADMGEREVGLSIERINVNGDYEPRNCCWLPIGLQSTNRRPWQHTSEGIKAIAESRKRDWKEGIYDEKVAKQREQFD